MAEPIDFVIIWVDGSDPEWLARKNHYLALAGGIPGDIDAGPSRYRDWDNLRYWFRAVETYAPWVNRVHFVTCGQVPPWLNPEAPKLNFVRHSDFIPEEFLPTFSSHPIELNLHRIPGLSEQFVYFNDDFFLTAPVAPEDFFWRGLPQDSIGEEPIQFPVAELYNNILINNMVFLNRHFDRFQTRKTHWRKWFSLRAPHDSFKNLVMTLVRKPCFFGMDPHHLPQAYLKSSLEAVWAADPEQLRDTCSHKFRDARDISQFAVKFYQLMQGQFHPYDKHKFGVALPAEPNVDRICQIIRQRQYKALCINDGDMADFAGCRDRINAAFAEALPNKSSFER